MKWKIICLAKVIKCDPNGHRCSSNVNNHLAFNILSINNVNKTIWFANSNLIGARANTVWMAILWWINIVILIINKEIQIWICIINSSQTVKISVACKIHLTIVIVKKGASIISVLLSELIWIIMAIKQAILREIRLQARIINWCRCPINIVIMDNYSEVWIILHSCTDFLVDLVDSGKCSIQKKWPNNLIAKSNSAITILNLYNNSLCSRFKIIWKITADQSIR